jgi:hypothetical protein
MNETTTLAAPILPDGTIMERKFHREQRAFRRLLPQLLTTHRGKFVAIHGEQVVDCGDDKVAVALRVLTKLGNVDIYVGLVTDEPAPIFRSGVRRELPSSGGEV